MSGTRKLTLKKESLSDLTTDDLRGVVGGAPDQSGTTCPLRACLASDYNCAPTFRVSCLCTPAVG